MKGIEAVRSNEYLVVNFHNNGGGDIKMRLVLIGLKRHGRQSLFCFVNARKVSLVSISSAECDALECIFVDRHTPYSLHLLMVFNED